MPLYDPDHKENVSPEDAVVVVHRFLKHAHAWATEQEIPKRLARVEADLDPAEAAKLHGWITYLRFTEHTLSELEDGRLDRWFPPKA